jgi:hypothetical protein
MDGVRRVPCRLPQVASASLVLIFEGEQCVRAVRKLGLPSGVAATTNSEGTGKFGPELVRHFVSKQVVISPDNDEPGRRHVLKAAAVLMGVAASVGVVELPGLQEKGDVKDWLDAGGTLAKLLKLARSAKPLDAAALSTLKDKWGFRDEHVFKTAPERTTQALAAITALKPGLALPELESALRAIFDDVAGSDPLQCEIVREAGLQKLKELGCSAPVRLIDAAFQSARFESPTSNSLSLTDVEPWPKPVDGEALLSDVAGLIRRFIVLPEWAADAIALWVLHAHGFDAFGISPFLTITSPQKRCGKTRLISIIAALVPRALGTSNITPAAVFRTIEACRPTLLMDEADTFIKESEELRGILNSGHSREMAFIIRLVGTDYEPKRFSTWCPKVVALIGKAPATVEDRSVIVPMQRKTAAEKVEKWRKTSAKSFEPLQRKVARWVADNIATLEAATPDVPNLGSDRAEDNWAPLLAIAELAGGVWPQRAIEAARALTGGLAEDESDGVLLLADLRKLFVEEDVVGLPSAKILKALEKLEHRPWAEWKNGKPMTTVQLAKELRVFGIRPRTIRLASGMTPKGYRLTDFKDAFMRYLPEQAATNATNLKTK